MWSRGAAWVSELLILLPDVEIVSASVEETYVWSDPTGRRGLVGAVGLNILAQDATSAAVLVEALGLGEHEPVEKDEGWWRYWRGWCAGASREVPVTIQVCVVEHLAAPTRDVVAA